MAKREILLSGSGGQGVLFLGNILSLAAAQKGKRVATTPSYGAAVRGGEVKCGVIFSDEEIYDPIVDEAEILVALNEASLKAFGPQIKEQGLLICGDSEENRATIKSWGKRVQVIPVPLKSLGGERTHNMIALGVFLEVEPELTYELIKAALTKEMKKRGRENLVEENLEAVQQGIRWYREKSKG